MALGVGIGMGTALGMVLGIGVGMGICVGMGMGLGVCLGLGVGLVLGGIVFIDSKTGINIPIPSHQVTLHPTSHLIPFHPIPPDTYWDCTLQTSLCLCC